MAVAASTFLTGSSATPGTSFTTASITPVSNRLYLLTVSPKDGASTQPLAPTVTGAGLTWVLVDSNTFDNAGASRRSQFLFRGLVSSPSSGALTIDFGAVSHEGCIWSIDEVTGMDTTGT